MENQRKHLPQLKTPVGPRIGGPRTGIGELIWEMIAAPAGPAPLGQDASLPRLKTPVSPRSGGPRTGLIEVIIEMIASPETSAERGE